MRGPTVSFENGEEWWIVDGEFHREDGPAIVSKSGHGEWYHHGLCYYRGFGEPPEELRPQPPGPEFRFENTLREWEE